jgi:biotin synthase
MNKSEIYYYLRSHIPRDHEEVMTRVDAMRTEAGLDRVHAAGIITLSSFCVRDCIYCGFRADHPESRQFRLARSQIIAAAESAAQAGLECLILKSGVDPGFAPEALSELLRDLKARFGFELAVSMGERELAVYRRWREAGAEFYWLRHETCDPHLYRRIRPSMYWVDRMRGMEAVKEAGFQVGTGILIGMPNQSFESLVEDIMLFLDPAIKGIVIDPFLPPPDSPGYQLIQKPENMIVEPSLATMEKVIAITRLFKPWAIIPLTNAHVSIYNALETKSLFRAGANCIMFDFTPREVSTPDPITPMSGIPAAPGVISHIKTRLAEHGLALSFKLPDFSGR